MGKFLDKMKTKFKERAIFRFKIGFAATLVVACVGIAIWCTILARNSESYSIIIPAIVAVIFYILTGFAILFWIKIWKTNPLFR
jgi:low affinity Fe/Cu permease